MNFESHWFMKEEWIWRSVAAAVWATFSIIPLTSIFLFGITIDFSRHIFMFSDFLSSLLSLHFFVVCLVCGILSSLLVALYSRHIRASTVAPSNHVQLMKFFLQPSSLIFLLTSTAFFYIASRLLISLRCSSVQHSDDHRANDDETEKLLQMAEHISTMTSLFSCTAGFFYAIDKLVNSKMQLQFLKVQETKFLYLKCKLPCLLSESANRSARYLYYFLILYYVLEFAIITVVSPSNLSIFSVLLSFRLWWIFDMIPLLWSLWLTGTCSLLLYDLSWQILNAFQTQLYAFPIANPMFSVDEKRLLVKNLNAMTPPIVQCHAFHMLSLMVKQSSSKRQQIFSLSGGVENGQPVICNIIMNSCLDRIRKLTGDINNFQAALLEAKDNDKTLNVENRLGTPSANGNCHDVTTPQLWARLHDSKVRHRGLQHPKESNADLAQKTPSQRNIFSAFGFQSYTKGKKVPVTSLCIIYRDHMITKWSLQTISYLCLKSVEEDDYGVVQGHLKDCLSSIIELKKALEIVEKNAQSTNALSRLHQSLQFEVKTSLYRIAAAYRMDLLSVNLSTEQEHVILGFINYEE